MPNKQCCICNSLLIFSYTPLCYRFCICLFVCIFQIVYATNAVSEIFASENCFTSFLYFSVRFLISFFILRVSTILFAFFCLFLPFFFTFTIFYSVLYLVYLLFVLYIFKKKKTKLFRCVKKYEKFMRGFQIFVGLPFTIITVN